MMLPNLDPSRNSTSRSQDLDWICRLYTEEVWAYLHPSYRPRIAPDHEFMEQVEERFTGVKTTHQFRQDYAQAVKSYARAGIKFSWNAEPCYQPMFLAYHDGYGTSNVMKTTARLINMDELLVYINEWVSRAAYFEWEREGRPDGRAGEHWERAMRAFRDTHQG